MRVGSGPGRGFGAGSPCDGSNSHDLLRPIATLPGAGLSGAGERTVSSSSLDSLNGMAESSHEVSEFWPIILAYLIGATPFGLLAGKMRGIDIRDHGSGNIGATNVLRVLGKPVGITVLILDLLKGLVPVLIAKAVSDSSLTQILSAIAAILGHNYTFWLRFKGGKGIATSAGAVGSLMAIPLGIALALWGLLFLATRYVSIASIGAALSLPVTVAVQSVRTGEWNLPLFGFAIFLAVMATWRHRSNINRLLAGKENRFDLVKKSGNSDSEIEVPEKNS